MKIYEEISAGTGAQVGGAFPGRASQRACWVIRRAEEKDAMERVKFISKQNQNVPTFGRQTN